MVDVFRTSFAKAIYFFEHLYGFIHVIDFLVNLEEILSSSPSLELNVNLLFFSLPCLL